MSKIGFFTGVHRYLSNFWACPVLFQGILYQSAEAAYQAQKSLNPEIAEQFAQLSPSEAKRQGKCLRLRKDWETIKFDVMRQVVMAKFDQNPRLRTQLMRTYPFDLEEGNTWGDTCWGVVNGQGENHLGEILMELRERYIRETA